jgi:hypothetical protein
MSVLVTLKTRNGPEETFIAESVERRGVEVWIKRRGFDAVRYKLEDLEYWTKVDDSSSAPNTGDA